MSSVPTDPSRHELAAEYALGVLEGAELEQARALENSDQGFRDEVAQWTTRLTPLLDDVAPVDPPASVLAAIERKIGGPTAAGDNIVELRGKLTRWRAFGAGATALAASLALVLLLRPPAEAPLTPPAAKAPMVAMIEGSDSEARLMAMWDEADRALVLAAAAPMPASPGKSHELWVIPADGKPRSMGVMPASGPMRMPVPEPMADQLKEGVTLAISVEPLSGSPTGLPTGPVIATGTLRST